MLFIFTIIDGKNFRKIQPFRYGLYYILIALFFIINQPKERYRNPKDYNSFAQLLGINTMLIWMLIVIIGLLTLLLHLYSKNYRHWGKIEISNSHIKIIQDSENRIFNLKNISDLVIERGSTWHYNYKEDNYLIEIDNWIKFTVNNENIEIEFAIMTMQENSNFEELIASLNNNRIDFKYFSI